jgi:hypothetical protein
MSYGQQLNIFRAKGYKYGVDWRGVVLCSNLHELKLAREDAVLQLKGRYFSGLRMMKFANGASLRFRVVTNVLEARQAFAGQSFTHVIWLHRPDSDEVRDLARATVRSKTVPAEDWRYEYCMVG